jgi:cytochrome c peroxidase
MPTRLLILAILALPAQAQPANKLAPSPEPDAPPADLSLRAQLGRDLFFDTSLSNPPGQSCASCHAPQTGFTFPDSQTNRRLGVPPGVVPGRFVARAVPQVSYASFIPPGPPQFNPIIELFVGGQFWDGRATDLVDQAKFPFVNPNEMNNLTNNQPDPAMVVRKVQNGPHAAQFRAIFGEHVFEGPTDQAFEAIAVAIAQYESSDQVNPFSSKYDAWRAGVATLTPSEMSGLRLMTGSWTGRPDGAAYPRFAHCFECHMIPSVPSASPDVWTAACFQNIGVPRNRDNPFYRMTDQASNPVGYNPLGQDFVDFGLGDTMYPMIGLPPGNSGPGSNGQGDFLAFNGQFKSPSLRNVDKRPHPGFVKAYMHNGALKSLEDVVHFYNTRNLTTRAEVIDFTRANPYQGLRGRPLWDTPEFPSPDTLVNPDGILGTLPGDGPGGESGAQVGNLGMTRDEERDIVAFLKTLSDGYFDPASLGACAITSQPVPQRVCVGGSARMTVASNIPECTYQWRRNGEPILGATVSFHDIVIASPRDAGVYDCVITAPCGSITSHAAPVDVCPSDFNCDGGTDRADLEAFLAAIIANDPAADINQDGALDQLDVAAFMEAYDRGC